MKTRPALANLETVTTFEDLQQAVATTRTTIRSSGNAQATEVESLMDLSARHVMVAALGAPLFREAHRPTVAGALATDSATLHTAAYSLTFSNGQTSVDFCASALMRWHGEVPQGDHQFDFQQLRRQRRKLNLTKPQQGWFDHVDINGAALLEFRHAIVHRVVRQDIHVTIGQSPHSVKLSHTSMASGTVEADIQLTQLADFVEESWRMFWTTCL